MAAAPKFGTPPQRADASAQLSIVYTGRKSVGSPESRRTESMPERVNLQLVIGVGPTKKPDCDFECLIMPSVKWDSEEIDKFEHPISNKIANIVAKHVVQ